MLGHNAIWQQFVIVLLFYHLISFQWLITSDHVSVRCPKVRIIPGKVMICIVCVRSPSARAPLLIVAIRLYPDDHVVTQVLIPQQAGKYNLLYLHTLLYSYINLLSPLDTGK
jgi:hypothetical protein